MGSPQAIEALILGVAVMFVAPALVWALVVGGLVRIVRERVKEERPAEADPNLVEADRGAGSL
ncbi:MAG: hypothetical protein PVJ55_00900 [Anaerolineae bacterium]|jgi:hypothetical protein